MVAFFLAAQPSFAAQPSAIQELKDDESSQGFIDADQAQQAHQRQLNEVDRMQSIFEDGDPNNSESQSVLSKFQNSEEEDLNNDVALSPTPIAETGDPNLALADSEDANEEEENPDGIEELASNNEEEGPQPVAKAEVNEQDSTTTNNEETNNALALAPLSAETTNTDNSSESQQSGSSDSFTTQEEETELLAGLSVVAIPDPLPEQPLEVDSVEEIAVSVVQSDSAVATELVALMGMNSVGAAVGGATPTPYGMDGASMMGALPENYSAPTTTIQTESQVVVEEDPPIVELPIPPPTNVFIPGTLFPQDFDFDQNDQDIVGGVALFGSLLEAIRSMIFADANLGPNGLPIGDGINDSVTLLSAFMVMFFQFFGLNFSVNQLRDLILRGSTASMVDLFGIAEPGEEPLVPVTLLFSAFLLATSLFFPLSTATGVDVNDVRSRKPGAYTITLPLFISEDLLISLGKFTDPSITDDGDAAALGRTVISSGIGNVLGITLSIMGSTDGEQVKIIDPNNPNEVFGIKSDKTLTLELPPGAIQFVFFGEGAPEGVLGNESLLPFLQALDGSQIGLFGFFIIDLGSIVNAIGSFITEVFTDNLGAVLKYYESIGSTTGISGPPPFMPLLLKLGFGFQEGAAFDDSKFFNPFFFPLTLALPLIFSLTFPPIPNIENPFDDNAFNKNIYDVFYSNAQDSFEDQQEAIDAAAKEDKDKKPAKPKEEKPGAKPKAGKEAGKAAAAAK